MALRTRCRSTCRRTTSMGSVTTLTSTGSHVLCWSVQPRSVTQAPTARPGRLFPLSGLYPCKKIIPAGPSSAASRPGPRLLPVTAGAGSRTSCRPGSPRGGAYGTRRRSCSLLCPPFALLVSLSLGIRADEMPTVPARRRPAPPDPPAFADRAEAGERLGAALREAMEKFKFHHFERPVVFAIPRGGVAVAAGVARCLAAPLEVIVVRKIGHPEAPEFGLGRDRGGRRTGLRRRGAGRGRAERGRPDRGGGAGAGGAGAAGRRLPRRRTRPSARERTGLAIVVDDGLATGVTARAALRAVARRLGGRPPVRTVLAVPVAAAGVA